MSRCVRILLRLLPFTAFTTCTLAFLLSKSLYESARGWQDQRLDTISTYGAGHNFGANIIVFRVGMALTVSQLAICVAFRASLLLHARAPKSSASSIRFRCRLVVLRVAILCATLGCLCGLCVVTIEVNDAVHYSLAGSAFGGLLLSQSLDLLAFSRYVLVPRIHARTARLTACWGALCITSSTACLLIHQLAFYHPPLQWAGALLALASYFGDAFSSVLLSASASPGHGEAGDLEAERTAPEGIAESDFSPTETWSLVCPGCIGLYGCSRWRCCTWASDERSSG